MFCLARELGVPIATVLAMSSLEIGMWRAMLALESNNAFKEQATTELRGHVAHGLTDIKDKLKHGNGRSYSR